MRCDHSLTRFAVTLVLVTPLSIVGILQGGLSRDQPSVNQTAVAQTVDEQKAEEDKVLQQCRQDLKNNYEVALRSCGQALTTFQQLKKRSGEARSLINLGRAYYGLSQYDKAISYYQQALAIAQQINDRAVEAIALNALGDAYDSLSQYGKAITYYQQALVIAQQIKDRNREAEVLGNLGVTYRSLSQYEKAISYFQQVLPIFQQIKDRDREAITLLNLGIVYDALSQYDKAISYYQQSLTIFQQTQNRTGQASVMGNLGIAYNSLQQYEKAIGVLQQSLEIARQVKDRYREAVALNNLGVAYQELSQYEKAISYYQPALAIAQSTKDRSGEASILQGLGLSYAFLLEETKAIAFYKQSVNVRETIREDISQLSRLSQESYTQSVAGAYRSLAWLLMRQGRLSEAQQVLELLKLRELKDLKRDQSIIPQSFRVTLTAAEQDFLTQVSSQASKAASLPAQPKSATLDPSNPFNRSAQSLLAAQPNAALIYYLISKNTFQILLITPDNKLQAIAVPTSANDLRKTVEQFRQQMEACERRPCTTADTASINATSKTLHQWLMPPALQTALQQAKATHLIFALDSVTRYLPIAALHDGNQYLIQNYTVSVVISTYLTDSQERLGSQASVLALGLSNAATVSLSSGNAKHSDRFNDLANVPLELAGIVSKSGKLGIYPGVSLLNQQFTLASLKQNLPKHRILHLATHGIFRADNLDASYIVLGDGTPLTIPMIDSALPNLANIHLVVLSACQTGLGGANQDGVEISGISNAFLSKGVKAIAASLWQVNDASTSVLMQQFYKNLATGKMTKAEALRQVQLSLLSGKLTAKDAPTRSDIVVTETHAGRKPGDFSHPYYWAPFILIGNGL